MARLERRLIDKTEDLLSDDHNWQTVERVAHELLQHQTISGRAVRHCSSRILNNRCSSLTTFAYL